MEQSKNTIRLNDLTVTDLSQDTRDIDGTLLCKVGDAVTFDGVTPMLVSELDSNVIICHKVDLHQVSVEG